jgi:hypothetical protein
VLENDLAAGMHEDDAVMRIARALQRPEDLGPAVDRAVMSALRAAPLAVVVGEPRALQPKWGAARRPQEQGWSRAWRWLVQPRAIRVSPLGALAAAGLAFVAATLGARRDAGSARVEDSHTGEFPAGVTGEFPVARAGDPTVSPTAVRTRDTVFVTRFMIVAPNAKQVALVGDFNDWDQGKTPLLKVAANGTWTAEVRLPPGRYAYAFLVDGQRWVADPAAPPSVGDDFGRPSSVVTVRGVDA